MGDSLARSAEHHGPVRESRPGSRCRGEDEADAVDVQPCRRGHALTTLAAITVSLVTGTLTHLLWDAFTHTNGVVVRAWPALRATVVGPHLVYNVIQYVSSTGGLLLIGWWLRRWYLRTTPPTGPCGAAAPSLTPIMRRVVWSGVFAVAMVGAVAFSRSPRAGISAYDFVRCVLLGGSGGLAGALALFVLSWQLPRILRSDTSHYRSGHRVRTDGRYPDGCMQTGFDGGDCGRFGRRD